MRKLSSIFLAAILMLAISSTIQVAHCETKGAVQASVNVKPLTTTTVPISGDIKDGWAPRRGPWGGAGAKITKIIVQFSWTPTSYGAVAGIVDNNITGYYYPNKSPWFIYGGWYDHGWLINGSAQYDQWYVDIGAQTNGGWMHYSGYIYIVYG